MYAIGDLHLSFSVDKSMDVFGGAWNNYTEKIKSGFEILKPDDICVLCGDTSWGMSFEESLEDFKFLDAFPGKKLIIKGNHDYWWNTVSKMKAFFMENNLLGFDFLHNNCFFYNNIAICGTRGWLLEDDTDTEHYNKIIAREASRLRTSFSMAGDVSNKLCFLHYPPRSRDYVCDEIIDVMYEFNVKHCFYGHIHGEGHKFATVGNFDGISYDMVSADYLNFFPLKIL